MSDKLTWSVATPDGTAAFGECEFLVVPTTGGELGILADHAALVACVAPGELRVTAGQTVSTYAVGPGVIEVRDNRVSLLLSSVSGKPRS
jgi:F-type H+-transporting ATPase subunit epsilon